MTEKNPGPVDLKYFPEDWLEQIPKVREVIRIVALGLLEDRPFDCAHLMLGRKMLEVLAIAANPAHVSEVVHLGGGAKAAAYQGAFDSFPSERPPATAPKIKHLYGPDGKCTLIHDGSSCGQVRKRKARVQPGTVAE
ncbi:MAG TPA: hypothetical protein VJ801_14675 [Polyangia bacterium]|jgi:hypothetical protein|nr:hypothetical protein [Polyangia bacterium]